MYPLIETWELSNQSRSAFCELQGVNIHTFGYWLQKYRKENGLPSKGELGKNFISLQVRDTLDAGVELSYPNGVRLNFRGAVSVAYLSSLIQLEV